MTKGTAIRVGLISDTHGLLRPEAIDALQGSDLILHAGDIGEPEILAALETIAPVTAVRGNNDRGAWAAAIPEAKRDEVVRQLVQVGDLAIYLLHDLTELEASASGFQMVISGHSHQPKIEERKTILFVNPGNAGRRRFKLPITIARLEIKGAAVSAEIIDLAIDLAV